MTSKFFCATSGAGEARISRGQALQEGESYTFQLIFMR